MHNGRNIIGLDLSGPVNIADTSLAVFTPQGEKLCFVQAIHGARDDTIFDLVSNVGKQSAVVVGIDAPLSYNPGGGDRPSDRELRHRVLEKGRVGVMPPTLIRMVYLTLRGIALTRALETLKPHIELAVVEVHPGACMLLRDALAADVAAFKRDEAARLRLLEWLEGMGLSDLPRPEHITDHFVAASAAALAAWKWSIGGAVWCYPAQPPEHPYDFAC
jgi:predicted nuclease with RNAse H fold